MAKRPFLKAQQPQEPATPSRGQAFRRLLGYITAYKLQVSLSILFILLGTLALLVPGFLVGQAINIYIVQEDKAGLANAVIQLLVASAAAWVLMSLSGLIMAEVTQKAMFKLRQEMFEHIQTLSLRFYDRQPIGELMSRILNDVDTINQFFEKGFTQLIQAVFMLLAVTTIMLLISPAMTIAVLLILPFMGGLILFTANFAGPAFSALQEELGELNGFMEENITGNKVLKAYQMETHTFGQLEEISLAAMKAGIRANFISLTVLPLATFFVNADTALVGLTGGILSLLGTIEVGTVATFLIYSRQFARPLTQMAQIFNLVLQALAGAERVFQILDEEPDITNKPGAQALVNEAGEVVIRDLDFSYVPGRPVLHDINIVARPGMKIGLCGPTGAGKSTIINLIPRFYDIQRGDIAIDQQSIYDVQTGSLRQTVGIVLQEPFLFTDTVMNNLRYGRLDASDEACIEAAQLANAHEFISRLPQGYQTLLDGGGANLSQGQRQLITIARALLANRRILILDEATSSVDTRTERKLQQALERLMSGNTSFVIAHRLSTITDSHIIVALDRGRIVDIGSHQALMARKGFYYNLYMSQFKEELMHKKA